MALGFYDCKHPQPLPSVHVVWLSFVVHDSSGNFCVPIALFVGGSLVVAELSLVWEVSTSKHTKRDCFLGTNAISQFQVYHSTLQEKKDAGVLNFCGSRLPRAYIGNVKQFVFLLASNPTKQTRASLTFEQ